ncbi:MAG: 4'-phosphopantetheinyl transferase superfamily protein [Dysgonamonadaceae bacterium]|jgi:phosphopantetheinyl transferase|nr:4'-phosphopantetheinyl transferase superfamily protein [Dysgonamonadaceae bacterium]
MLYSIQKYKDGSAIAIWEITETEEMLRQICPLPHKDEEELRFITNTQRRKERLVVYLLLEQLFGKKIYLGYYDNGRPFLQNEVGDISISHTSRFACLIYHPTEHVGIDIENTLRNFSAVEQKALSEKERDYLNEKNRNTQLCLIWSAKEALYKYIGESGIDFAAQLEIEKFTPHKKGQLEATYTNKEQETTTYELSYEVIADHVMVWIIA